MHTSQTYTAEYTATGFTIRAPIGSRCVDVFYQHGNTYGLFEVCSEAMATHNVHTFHVIGNGEPIPPQTVFYKSMPYINHCLTIYKELHNDDIPF